MSKASSEEKSDGLEIISIGKLYSGPWEKKYWSSSRGKDRYPYPIGFKAVRTQNGITYRMEILEGLKGPLFTISSTDGLSCSGQTPDIAWESFQKKSCSRIKFWHGKRFSCKIDGMEFFGFKNAFVQRLLRELVANIGGATEQNLLPSGICIEASETRDQIQLADLSSHPDLQEYLAKPMVMGKRSRKETTIKATTKSVADFKRVRPQNREHDADASCCGQGFQANYTDMIPDSYGESDFNESARALLRSPHVESPIEEELLVSVEDDLKMRIFDASHHLKVDHCPQEDNKRISSGSSTTIGDDGNLSKDKETLDRSKVSAEYQFDCLITGDEDGERTCTKPTHNPETCVPDTLDHSPETSCMLKDVITADMSISEVLATDSESLREDEMGTSNSNGSSEKGDLNSVGQDIAKSMMTVLLPRALPLLKTFSRKKKKNVKPSEMSTHSTMAENEKIGKVASPARELKENSDLDQKKKAQISVSNHEGVGHLQSILPDSFDEDESGNLVNNKLHLLQDIPGADQALVCPATCKSKIILDAEAEKSVFHHDTTDSKTSIHCKAELVLNQGPQEDDDSMSKSSLGFTFPSKEDSFTNYNENNLCVRKQPAEDDGHTLIDYAEDIFDPTTSLLDQDLADIEIPPSYSLIQRASCSTDVAQKKDVKDSKHSLKVNNNINLEHNGKLQDNLKLLACYAHPMPISAVLLSTVGNDIYVCVICGFPVQKDKILFIYSAPTTGDKTGYPSFVGHASIILPMSEDTFGTNIAVDISGLQFTPDGQSLVLLNSIKVPCCREGNIHCPCPSCTSDCFEKNAVKVVHVKVGYVVVVNKLKTAQNVRCILVCKPNHLVAADESGKIYMWVMNSRWSAQIEECHLPMPDNRPSCLVELKKIPKSAALIIGHNGFGKFGLWDIEKRIIVSKFSAPGTPIFKCVPISLFQWPKKCVSTDCNPEELTNEVLDASKMWPRSQLPRLIDSEDAAIWLLVSTISYPEFQHGHQAGDWQMNSVGCWRLALLVKDTVIMGSPLDISAAATGALVGHGIIGRYDGLVYMWELSTGTKIGNLHHFKGSGVSCIATDSSNSGALAIASDGGDLLVYNHP